jgi:hypothetical protein
MSRGEYTFDVAQGNGRKKALCEQRANPTLRRGRRRRFQYLSSIPDPLFGNTYKTSNCIKKPAQLAMYGQVCFESQCEKLSAPY